MKDYKIYYISRELFESEKQNDMRRYYDITSYPGDKKIKPLKKDYEFKFEGEFEDLEDVFTKCQNDFGDKPFIGRSMMVGDIVIYNDTVYICDVIGFYKTEWKEEI